MLNHIPLTRDYREFLVNLKQTKVYGVGGITQTSSVK